MEVDVWQTPSLPGLYLLALIEIPRLFPTAVFLCYNNNMSRGGKTWSWARWFDEWRLAGSGILLATRERRFVLTALLTFVIFGTIMSLLSGSTAAWSLFWATDLAGKLAIIGDGFLALFGVGRSFLDWLLLFSIAVLQAILIGLVALVWQKKRRSQSSQVAATAANADNLQSAGLAAGLAVLGSGCPTCGTTLLMPLIGTLFSTSSYALAGVISGVLTAAAVLVALLTLKRLGNDAYALIVSERFQRRHQAAEAQPKEEREI